TSWELLLKDRSCTDRPKLVLFGRDTAAEDVYTSLELYGEGITLSRLTLDFFDHDEATAMVEAYAEVTPTAREWPATPAGHATVEAFFEAIASALGTPSDELWSSAEGRAFVGYAPVLAAMGTLLANESNPARLQNVL